jgi:hypothetical protein
MWSAQQKLMVDSRFKGAEDGMAAKLAQSSEGLRPEVFGLQMKAGVLLLYFQDKTSEQSLVQTRSGRRYQFMSANLPKEGVNAEEARNT